MFIHSCKGGSSLSRGFNSYEKQIIRNSLIEQGKFLFSKYGFQKTSIREITKDVGIAQGTFYSFFKSKEELYFVILESEEKGIREQLFNVEKFKEQQPKKVIKDILHQMIYIIETNPLIRQLFLGTNMEDMLRKLPPDLLEKHFRNDSTSLITIIETWRSEGVIFKENPEVIAGVLRSLFVLTLHQHEIGETVYRETVEVLINLIVDGLFKKE